MKESMESVRAFHVKHNFPVDVDLRTLNDPEAKDLLTDASIDLLRIAKTLESALEKNDDPRIRRTSLMIEELGESVEALLACDEVALLDGLSDLAYVTNGTAVAFNLPLEKGVREVCKSNMTKAVRDPSDKRLRNKGESFVAPDLKRVLNDARQRSFGAFEK